VILPLQPGYISRGLNNGALELRFGGGRGDLDVQIWRGATGKWSFSVELSKIAKFVHWALTENYTEGRTLMSVGGGSNITNGPLKCSTTYTRAMGGVC
jgi:hypothetical protein